MDIQKIQERLKDYQEHEKQLLTAGPSRATMIEMSQQIIQENYLDDVTNLLSIISQLEAKLSLAENNVEFFRTETNAGLKVISQQTAEIAQLKDTIGTALYELERLERNLDMPERGYVRNCFNGVVRMLKESKHP